MFFPSSCFHRIPRFGFAASSCNPALGGVCKYRVPSCCSAATSVSISVFYWLWTSSCLYIGVVLEGTIISSALCSDSPEDFRNGGYDTSSCLGQKMGSRLKRVRLDVKKKRATSGTTVAVVRRIRNTVFYIANIISVPGALDWLEWGGIRCSGCMPSTFDPESSEDDPPGCCVVYVRTGLRPYLCSDILYSVRSFRELLCGLGTSVQHGAALAEANPFRSMSAASGQAPADHICRWSVTRYPRVVSTAILVSKSYHQSQSFIQSWQNPHPVPNAPGQPA